MRNKKILVSLSAVIVIAVLVTLISSFAFAQTGTESIQGEEAAAADTEITERVCPVTGEPCTGENYGPQANRRESGEAPGIGEQVRQRLRDGTCAGNPDAAAERQQHRRGGQGKSRNDG